MKKKVRMENNKKYFEISFANYKLKDDEVKTLGLLMFISMIFYWPVIYAQSFYADDLARVQEGYFGWDIFGRYLAKAVAQIYSLNFSLIIDAAPLTWVASIFIVALSSFHLYRKIKKIDTFYALTLSVLFIINPFYIQNLLYRYDSVGMFLALYFTVLAFCTKKDFFGCILSFSFLYVGLNFYQTFSNLYLSLVAIELLLLLVNNRQCKIYKTLLTSLCIYSSALLLYYLELKLLHLPSKGEIEEISFSIFFTVFNNVVSGFYPFIDFWNKSQLWICIPLVFFSISLAKLFFKYRRSWIYIFISIVLIFISSVGPMALLNMQFVEPRGLSYFSALLMFICLVLMNDYKHQRLLMIAPVFVCFVFAYRVGNIHRIQTEFEKPIYAMAAIDLSSLHGIKQTHSIGSVKLSTYVSNIRSSTPFNGFLERDDWRTTGGLLEYGSDLALFEWDSNSQIAAELFHENKAKSDLIVSREPFYEIYISGDVAWIVWL